MAEHNKSYLKEFLNTFLGFIGLRAVVTALRTLKVLEYDYGHYLSSLRWQSVDKKGSPIPWFCYAATRYLEQFDFEDKYLFEYGSGNSTLFWAKRCKKVVSVEQNIKWYTQITKELVKHTNSKIIFAENKFDYINAIRDKNVLYDVIVIDGAYRLDCAKTAVKMVKRGGIIILDNGDWFPKTAKFIRSKDFLEVDFSGFGPITPYITTTSIFFERNFRFNTLSNRQPRHLIGGLKHSDD